MKELEKVESLSKIDFSGKGEAFVESRFLTPLLECLGYETHVDYEVLRHGDDGVSFKLSYPPVEKGAVRVKHYNPDYIPTIRKKMFWIVEAKSPKAIKHPFDFSFVTQGLQYCIHPEIQANYLVLSNGIHTSIFDAYSAVFLDTDMFNPILEFRNTEVVDRWSEIYSLLGVENIRNKIEEFLVKQFEKLCLSSLDEKYPDSLSVKITSKKPQLKQQIRNNVLRLNIEHMDKSYEQWQEDLRKGSLRYLEICMEYPIRRGKEPSQHYIEWRLKEDDPRDIMNSLISGYERSCYFKKEHIFIALCHLFNLIDDEVLCDEIKIFIIEKMAEPMPLLNKVESALIRILRKKTIIHSYPKLREEISAKLDSLPEMARFIGAPKPQDYTFKNELRAHEEYFPLLESMDESSLLLLLPKLLKYENSLEDDYCEARDKLPRDELEMNGFESYGTGDVIYTLKNIAHNFGLISKHQRASV